VVRLAALHRGDHVRPAGTGARVSAQARLADGRRIACACARAECDLGATVAVASSRRCV
jgi:hypothetical protein